jgi:hypothetical protein
MPILELLSLLQAGLLVAPKAVEVAINAKNLLNSMLAHGLVPVSEQGRVNHFVNSIDALVASGEVPLHWQVEPDPTP